jgi:hypothetical protein
MSEDEAPLRIEAAPTVLDYQRPRRRRVRRAVVGAVIVALVIAVGTGWFVRKLQQQRAQAAARAAAAAVAARQNAQAQLMVDTAYANLKACREYSAPASEIVYESNPGRANALSIDSRYRYVDSYMPSVQLTPKCYRDIQGLIHYPDGDCAGTYGLTHGGIMFLHDRRAGPSADAVLVRVQLGFIAKSKPVLNPVLIRHIFDDGAAPKELGILLDVRDEIRFFAGQPDSQNAAHFTIGYELNGRYGTIDGVLLGGGDGDDLQLTPREGTVLPGAAFPVWQPLGTKGTPATTQQAILWPK